MLGESKGGSEHSEFVSDCMQAYHDMATFNAGAGGMDGSIFFELDRAEARGFKNPSAPSYVDLPLERRRGHKQHTGSVRTPHLQVHSEYENCSYSL